MKGLKQRIFQTFFWILEASGVKCVCMSSLFHEYIAADWKNVVEIVTVELLICSCGDAISIFIDQRLPSFLRPRSLRVKINKGSREMRVGNTSNP